MNQYFETGLTLMKFDSSYSHCLLIEFKTELCDCCFLKKPLKQCSACKFMHYCSVECQRDDWLKFHRLECSSFKSYLQQNKQTHLLDSDMNRLFIRLLIRGQNFDTSICDEIGLKSFDTLKDHLNEIKNDPDRMKCFYELMSSVRCIMGGGFIDIHENKLGIEKFISYFGKMVINSFSISNENEGNIGTGIYLSGSSLNHSCEPNCAVLFNGSKMLVKVIKKFEKNIQQATISYTEYFTSKIQRQEYLLKNYYFKCTCLRCSSNEDLKMHSIKCKQCGDYSIRIVDDCRLVNECEKNCKNFNNKEKEEEEEEKEKEVIDCVKQIESVLNECQRQTASKLMVAKSAPSRSNTNVQLVDRVQKLMLKAERLFDGRQLDETQSSRNLYTIKLYELLMDLFIQNERFDKAFLIATNKLMNAFNLYLPQLHPSRELLLVKIIKLSLYLQEFKNVGAYLKEARLLVEANREPEHSLYKEFQELAFQLNAFI